MEGQIKVTPEDLTAASSEFAGIDSNVSNIAREMMSLVTGLATIYEGEAAQAYINTFKQLEDDMNKIHNKIQEHSTDLAEMARVYQEVERKTQELNRSVPTNLIQ
jgi:WXG100 family type VII secretion target